MENRTYAFKASVAENTISGAAAVMGNVDRYDSVIMPGAFKGVLKQFLAEGFVPTSHDWDWASVVAMPIEAKESGIELQAVAEFHSTQRAQDARTIAKERSEKGLSVGLSIGFSVAKSTDHEDGEDMLKWAKGDGANESLLDTKSIKAHKGSLRTIEQVGELYEFSIVTVPANPKAVAINVRSGAWPHHGVPLDEEYAYLLAGLDDLLTRVSANHESRGRISASRLEDIAAMEVRMADLRAACAKRPDPALIHALKVREHEMDARICGLL